MPYKLYDYKVLEKYSRKTLIIDKTINGSGDDKANFYSFEMLIKEIKSLLRLWEQSNLTQHNGIALDFNGSHSVGECILILTILNYNCRFCPYNSRDSLNHLAAYRIKYFIAKCKDFNKERLDFKLKIQLFDEEYFLYELVDYTFAWEHELPLALCYTLSTSGSTGKPKLVHVPYHCIACNVMALCNRLDVTSEDVIFLSSSTTFDPFFIEFFMALERGCALMLVSKDCRLSPNRLLERLWPSDGSNGVTILQMTPSLFRMFGSDAIHNSIFNSKSSLRILLLGGEEFPSMKEIRTWTQSGGGLMQPRLFNIYGITELSCWSTIYEVRNLTQRDEDVPIGEVIDSETEVRIRKLEDSSYLAVDEDGEGELEVGSSTRKCFIPTLDEQNVISRNEKLFRKTGDLMRRHRGEIFYVGRLNNTIKRLGKRLCLDELSKKIKGLMDEDDYLLNVHCLWNEKTNQLICCLQIKEKINAREKHMRTLILKSLLDFEKPDKIVFLSIAPINAHGKVDRRELLQKLLNQDTEPKKPLNVFLEFLNDVLNLEIDCTHDQIRNRKRLKLEAASSDALDLSFTQAGGTSFHALSLATEIGEKLSDNNDQRLLLEKFLDDKVKIRDLIEFLENAKTSKPMSTQALSISTQSTRNSSKFHLDLVWRNDLKKCVDSSPTTVLGNYVVVGSHAHIVCTMDVESGKEISKLHLPDRIECQVAATRSEETLLVGCYDGYLYAFDPMTSTITWKVDLGGMIKAKPLIVEDSVIVGCYASTHNLFGISLENKNILWRQRIGNKPIFSSPISLGETTILASSLDGTYASLCAASGQILWQQSCESPIFSTPLLLTDDQRFLIAEVSGNVHLCNVKDGKKISSVTAEGNIFSSLVKHQVNDDVDLVAFGCHDCNAYCLKYEKSSKSLKFLWKQKMNSPVYATPATLRYDGKDYILICETQSSLSILGWDDGLIMTTAHVGGEIFSTPCIAYVATSGIDSKDQKQETDMEHSKQRVRVFFGCRDNFLYCFQLNYNSNQQFIK